MTTIFAIIRPWNPVFSPLQYNAIKSWLLLRPRPRIILFTEPNTDNAILDGWDIELHTTKCNQFGTPLVSDALHRTMDMAQGDVLVMANADNIYLPGFTAAIAHVSRNFPQFLMVGQRWDVSVPNYISFTPWWTIDLMSLHRDLHGKAAIDYLAFYTGDWLRDLPDFAVGRSSYDNEIVALTKAANIPVVDATEAVTVLHQWHPRGHKFANRAEIGHNKRLHTGGRGGVGQAGWELKADYTLFHKDGLP